MTNTLDIKSGNNSSDNEVKSQYSFCHSDINYSFIKNMLDTGSDKTLLTVLQLASDRFIYCKTFDKQHKRRLIRAIIHIILNERGIAPEFRDAKSGVTHRAKEFPDEAEESNDRQVIDLHWLYLHHRNEISPSDWNMSFLKKVEFDFNWASEFVSKARFTNEKIKRLGIPIKIQKLLLALREQDVLTIQKKVRSKTADVREVLINKINEPRSRLPKEKLEVLCATFRCLLLADGSPSDAIEYWRKMSLTLTNYSPEKILPWMKSRKVILNNLVKEVDKRKIKPKAKVVSWSRTAGAPPG
jgi:hypothetical protein